MTFIDMTVVNVALPALQKELGATITDVQWVVEAYALFLGALILVGGSLGDQFGRKRIFLIGVLWFTTASIWCGVASSPRSLIIGRALQGIGAAFLVPGSLSIIGATLAVAGLGGIVLGLLEWPALGPGHPLVVGSLIVGVVGLVLMIVAEHREKSPMMPLHLFQSRAFSLTNLLTLLLYGALGVVLFLVPLLLIQVKHYSATSAGAAFLPFPVIMFVLSRWSGGLVARTGPRLPLTAGPAIAAVGLALFARVGVENSYWAAVFPAVVVLGFGMAITVAPLTTTVMTAVPSDHAGVASGINNTVARVAGLLAIAVFGVVLVQRFETRMRPTLEQSWVSPRAKTRIENEMSKMAGAQLDSVPLDPLRRSVVQGAIHESFLSGFRLVVIEAGVLALVAAAFGAGIGDLPKPKKGQSSKAPVA